MRQFQSQNLKKLYPEKPKHAKRVYVSIHIAMHGYESYQLSQNPPCRLQNSTSYSYIWSNCDFLVKLASFQRVLQFHVSLRKQFLTIYLRDAYVRPNVSSGPINRPWLSLGANLSIAHSQFPFSASIHLMIAKISPWNTDIYVPNEYVSSKGGLSKSQYLNEMLAQTNNIRLL